MEFPSSRSFQSCRQTTSSASARAKDPRRSRISLVMSSLNMFLINGTIILTLLSLYCCGGSIKGSRVMDNFRLSETANPTHYTLKILTFLSGDYRFDGEVWIDFLVREATDTVTINTKNLNIFENETAVEEVKIKRDIHTLTAFRKYEPGTRYKSATNTRFSKKSNKKETVGRNENTNSQTQNSTTEEELPLTSTAPPTASSTAPTTAPPTAPTTAPPTAPPTSANDIDTMPTTITNDFNETSNDKSPTVTETSTNASEFPRNIIEHIPDTERQFLSIVVDKSFVPGKKYRLYMKYRGFLSDSFTGYHRVAYTKKNKKISWIASTIFEPVEARSAFPCFDEPEYKATFDITLGHSKEYRAHSNMPLKHTTDIEGKDGWQWDTFETTPKMSTFLVAFLISDLESLPVNEKVNRTEYGFWARRDVVHKTRYASKIVPKMMQYLEKEIGVQDVLPKIDFVALPSFMSHALENWGLISFSERGLLYSPGYTSIFSKYETTRLLGHELSHLWFGNSLTPRWWDQIWLSEGLSNFFETEAADFVQPNWDVKTYSAVASYLRIFSIDALYNTHPLVPQVKTLNDLNNIFDSIVYQKGYYLIRMLNYTLGEPTFKRGLRRYVEDNQLSTVDEDDLWMALTEQGHQDGTLPKEYDLQVIMRAWTRDAGYPVIQVQRDYLNRSAIITQERFIRPKQDYEYRDANGTAGNVQRWFIPVSYTTRQELQYDFNNITQPRLWLTPHEEKTVVDNIADDEDFVLMNIQAAGLYRVNYDYDNWALIVDYLLSDNYSNIAVINRVQIVDDLLDFARSGVLSYQQALDATKYLRQEKHYLPWKAALSNFEYISRMLRSTETSKVFKKFMRNLVSGRYDELGFDSNNDELLFESMNRKQIVKWACRTGHRECIRKSVNLFKKWTEEKKPDENNPIPSNLRSVVYCTAIEHGGARDWQFLWQRYLSNTVVTDKGAIITGLGCSKNTRTLRKYLDWSIKETSGIKKQDSTLVFKAVASNDIGFPLAKNFLKEHVNEYPKYVGNQGEPMNNMIDSLAKKMNQLEDLKELEEMLGENKSAMQLVPNAVEQATEKVKFNIGWLEQNFHTITEWLKFQSL